MTTLLTLPDFAASAAVAEGKFVHLRWRGENYLLFALSSLHRYHNQMVAEFLGRHGIRKHWVGGDRLEWDDPALVVEGGGRFRYDPTAATLSLWDRSTAYGPFDPAAVTRLLREAGPPWRTLSITLQ